MVEIDISKSTLAILVSGLYCSYNDVDVRAIPHSVWINVAEKLEYFLPMWDYNRISFEDWVKTCLLIYPRELFDEEQLTELQSTTLYWEYPNGNVVLVISMDISVINNVE